MKKLFTVLSLAALAVIPAMAQEVEETYSFKPYGYLELQGGAAYTLGETSFGDLISPAAALNYGYRFNPYFGLRLGASGWESKGYFTEGYKYNYVAGNLDAMLNLTNLFRTWKPKQVFNLYGFVGVGANYAFNNDEANDLNAKLVATKQQNAGFGHENFRYLWDDSKWFFVTRAGLEATWRLGKYWDFVVEANANMVNDHYNSKKADNMDWYFNALAGFAYRFGKGYNVTRVERPAPEPEPAPAPAPVVKEEPKPAPAPAVVKVEPMRQNIFFTRNVSKVVGDELAKVEALGKYMQQYPKSNVSITGYADVKTGNAKINQRLSELRAKAVADILQSEYGIDASRITTAAKGDTEQPFAENDENRVSVCIAAE